jgi:hypothetical protein
MASFVLATAERTNLANQIKTDLNGGYLKIYTAGYAQELVSIPLAATCGTVSNGVLTLDTTNMNANAGASGTAAVGRFFKSDGSTQVADCDVSTSGATVNLQNTSINSGQNVSITSGTITVPAGT